MSHHHQNAQGYNPNGRPAPPLQRPPPPPPPPPQARPDPTDPRMSAYSPNAVVGHITQSFGNVQNEYSYGHPSPVASYDRGPRPQYAYTGPAYSPHSGTRVNTNPQQQTSPLQPSYNPQDYSQPYRSPSQSYSPPIQSPTRMPPAAEPRPYNPADYRQDPRIANEANRMFGPVSGQYRQAAPPQPVAYRPPTLARADTAPKAPGTQAQSPQTSHRYSGTAPAPPPHPAASSPGSGPGEVPERRSASPRSNVQTLRFQSSPTIEVASFHQPSHLAPVPARDQMSNRPTIGTGSSTSGRPLPEIPRDSEIGRDDDDDEGSIDQDDLFNEVESAVGGSHGGTPDPRRGVPPQPFAGQQGRTVGAPQPHPRTNVHNHRQGTNGQTWSYETDEEEHGADSDAEAEAGIIAMKAAEEEEARGTGGFFINGISPAAQIPEHTDPPESPDSDVIPVDIGVWGGGPDPGMSYGPGLNDMSSGYNVQPQPTRPWGRSSGHLTADYVPSYPGHARVDESGTGGLFDPTVNRGRRLSFDEGDETLNTDDEAPQNNQYSAGPPEISFFPPNTHRPLPQPPPIVTGRASLGYVQQPPIAQSPWVRSQSLVSHPSSPLLVPPNRAKTDAEYKRAGNKSPSLGAEGVDTVSSTGAPLDLPIIPHGRRFQPSKLRLEDFDMCTEPWAMSSLISWLRCIAEGETDIREQTVKEAILALFDNKVPTMNFAEAEMLAETVVANMLQAEVLVKEEEWLKFGPGQLRGILFQLTGRGCYAPALHEHKSSYKCYSFFCQRTVKKLDLRDPSTRLTADWATFYGLTKQKIENASKMEVERQNVMHEIVQTEEQYMDQLNLLRSLYRDHLRTANPPIVSPATIDAFLQGVFGKLDAIQEANREYLLPQLKYRQKEQGPWITGFSDLFRDWIRKAKAPYIEYAANFVHANILVRQEQQRNKMFRSFLDEVRNHKDSNRLGWDSFLKAPITRLQRYGLLLSTVLRNLSPDSPERANLQTAIEEIRNVTLDCDARVAEMGRKANLSDLDRKLVLRQEMKNAGIDLKLSQMGRELLYSGDLQRAGGSRFTWLETHAFLFDNYLVLAKAVHEKDSSGGLKSERYDVSKLPIPMDVLVLESSNDDPVVKSSFKGTAPATSADARSARAAPSIPSGGPPALTHAPTHSSIGSFDSSRSSIVATTVLEGAPKDEKAMYPFRVKHLGKETYTLYASSSHTRNEWCDKIVEAKTKHAASLFAQNAEPFRLRVMADTAFVYDGPSSGPKTISIKGTPLSRAIDEVERSYSDNSRPGAVCKARVNCATTFVQPHGQRMVAVGTDYGVYISELGDTRSWTRAIAVLRVTQLAVLEDFNLFLLISDKALISYHLDVVSPVNGVVAANDSIRKAPQKLSGSKDVGFFVTGKMKDRVLVFYKKRESMSSTFKILEPILQKATTQKARFLSHRRGATEFFRDYDDFYIPAECMALSLFTTSLSVATSKGFEVLNLDKKTPWSIPDLSAPHVASIAQRLSTSGSALGMFRLNQTEFLCVYEMLAIYVNKHGEISRGVVMEFVGHAKSAALEAGYLVLFDADFVEIRDANNGRLKQVISGRDLRLLDDGSGWTGVGGNSPRSVKFALQHPEHERVQLVVELVLNESRRDV